MQATILLWFQNHASPALDALFEGITAFGEETIVLLVALFILWNIDKKKGYAISLTMLLSLIGNAVLKAIVREPRPFQVLSSIRGKRVETATGYSFPSGHSTISASFYGSVAAAFPSIPVRVLCVLLIILVPVSRLYLGVHWPVDVLVGTILGLGCVAAFLPMGRRMDDATRETYSLYIGSLCFLAAFVLTILLHLSLVTAMQCSDMMATLALTAGFLIGVWMDGREPYRVPADAGRKALRFALGIFGIILISALKLAIPSHLLYPGRFVRYLLIGLWATWLWPLAGSRLHLFL